HSPTYQRRARSLACRASGTVSYAGGAPSLRVLILVLGFLRSLLLLRRITLRWILLLDSLAFGAALSFLLLTLLLCFLFALLLRLSLRPSLLLGLLSLLTRRLLLLSLLLSSPSLRLFLFPLLLLSSCLLLQCLLTSGCLLSPALFVLLR